MHALGDWLSWMDVLSDQDYVVIDDFLDDALYAELRGFLLAKIDAFDQAGIGKQGQHMVKRSIRGDNTYWLDRQRDTELARFWHLVDETKSVLNRHCYLSLSGEEFHLAHYPPGSHYARHIDRFAGRNNRMISMVMYLNKDWTPKQGGALEIMDAHKRLLAIPPLAKRCVLFKSATVPHAVLKSHADRYSVTGWLLYQPAGLGPTLG
ncbi:2OG-Fe(II) oxygenase [Maribacter sp. 2307ULW6-5]|uniref:2OG-Fe(II) oxygenase n=1 Tax=Maribacter sp. 2307ULW6-5 TaxID=3386275 RepID=UPI0039BD8EF6